MVPRLHDFVRDGGVAFQPSVVGDVVRASFDEEDPFRASILARARFIEDLVTEQVARGVGQHVILGAGLDTFAQHRPELASRLLVFEIDQPGPRSWKRQRLVDLGLGIPPFLRLVPVDVEASAPS